MECQLSAGICLPASCMESSFLVMEYEQTCAAQNPSFSRPEHTCLATEIAIPSIPPSPPNPDVLARSFARCGVNSRMPLQAASEAVLKPLLHKYRALLPRAQWRAVCMQTMRSVQGIIDSVQTAPEPPSSPQPSVGSAMHAECVATEGIDSTMHAQHAQPTADEMPWEDLNAGVLATAQLLQCTLFNALQDSSVVV